MMVYTINIVPVLAVAIITYEAISMNRETRAIFKSKRDVEGFL